MQDRDSKCSLKAMKDYMDQGPINTIIFDLVGVLFTVDKVKALRKTGLFNIIIYYLKHGTNPLDDSLALLNRMRLEVPGEFQDLVAYKGIYLPACMLSWQRGGLSSQETLGRILQYYERLDQQNYFTDPEQKKTLIRMGHLLLNSAIALEIFKPTAAIEIMIKKLKNKKKYKLFILSNIDAETFIGIENLYKDFFGLFDGIVTSYQTKLLKPQPQIFNYLIDEYKLDPRHCCYIDDQQENLVTAQQLGMMTILCIKASKLRILLKNYGFF